MKINFLCRNYFECNVRICKKLNKFTLKQLETLICLNHLNNTQGKCSALIVFVDTDNLA